jgi:hypothetical protein
LPHTIFLLSIPCLFSRFTNKFLPYTIFLMRLYIFYQFRLNHDWKTRTRSERELGRGFGAKRRSAATGFSFLKMGFVITLSQSALSTAPNNCAFIGQSFLPHTFFWTLNYFTYYKICYKFFALFDFLTLNSLSFFKIY